MTPAGAGGDAGSGGRAGRGSAAALGGAQAQAQASGTGTLVVQTVYTEATGYPEKLIRASDGYPYVTVQAMDAYGHATLVQEGNGVTVTRGYDQRTGFALSTMASGPYGTVANFTTAWDGFGNLTRRRDLRNGSNETATYDDLNRLTATTLSYTLAGGGALARSFAYDKTGNRTQVCTAGDCVSYGYGAGGAGPHAVTSSSAGASYAYNGNGQMLNDNGKSLTWTGFGKALTITQTTSTVAFAYGPGGERYQKTVSGAASETVTYLQGAERLTVDGATSIRRTLSFAGVMIFVLKGAQNWRLYAVRDHLGSVVALSNANGYTERQMTYSPFGQRRTAGWANPLPRATAITTSTTQTDKGYTGQESLDAVQLVDYNARLYDPKLGRFLSVDPLIGHPGSTQSINPYSYVSNNPLNKIDPTGEETTYSENGSGGLDGCSMNAFCESATSVTIEGLGSISAGGAHQSQNNSKQQKNDDPAPTGTGTQSSNADNHTQNGQHEGISGKKKDKGNLPDFKKSIATRKLTKEEQKIKDAIDAQLKRYYEAIIKKGDPQAIKEYARTIVKFDPDYKSSPPASWGESCHNCDAGHANEITGRAPVDPNHDTILLGPAIIDLRNSHMSSFEYPKNGGVVFNPGPNGMLEAIAHEFGHTFEANSKQHTKYLQEENASVYMERLKKYFPSFNR